MNICPFCRHQNKKGLSNCANCGRRMYTEPQTEWSSHISQVAHGYRQPPARGITHGVQKDAIQNSWGARRIGRSKGNWGTEFALVNGSDGTKYLSITDWGTHGLTGQVFGEPEAIPDQLPADERLARFENMNFSGGNYGPGLYGRGKLIFQAASKRGEIVYDSLTVDGSYRLGRRFQEGRHLRQFPRALEGGDAKAMLALLTKTTLQPLAQAGTRIIVVDPLDEIVDAMNNGDFLRFVEETWWEILFKNDGEICVRVNGNSQHAKCPDLLRKLVNGELHDKHVHRVESQLVEVKGERYRIKRLCMAKATGEIPEDLRGLYLQRKGMKIGAIELKEMPADLEERFFGFIELDKDYEGLIVEAEGLEHYGFSAQFASYRELKKFAQTEFDNFKRKLGYAVDTQKTADQRAREALRAAHQKLNEIMDSLGLTGLGEPTTRRRDITVRVQDVNFPNGTPEVNLGDVISDITFRVNNHSTRHRHALKVFVETQRTNHTLIESLHSDAIELNASSEATVGPLTISLRKGVYPNFEEIACVCRVEDTTGKPLAHARVPMYVGVKKPHPDELVKLRLDNIEFPRTQSSRVNIGEEIKNIRYVIKNQTAHELKVKFIARTLDKEHDKQQIATIIHQSLRLKPTAEFDLIVPSVLFDAPTYGAFKDGGEALLRGRVVSAEDRYGHEKGDILAEHNLTFWLNRDPKGHGIFEDSETFMGGPGEPRAKVRQGSAPSRWVFALNVTHPHYIFESDKQQHYDYVFELMSREALYIALHAEKFEPFKGEIKVDDAPHEVSRAYNAALDRVLASYYYQ